MKEHPIIFTDILAISKYTSRHIMEDIKEYSIKKIEYLFLFELYNAGGDCSYEEIIGSTHSHKSTISNVITHLEQEGYVASYYQPNVKNRKRVRILPKGEDIAKTGIQKEAIWEDKLGQNITDQEYERMITYLRRIYYNLERYDLSNYTHSPNYHSIGYLSAYIKKRVRNIAIADERLKLEVNQKYILTHMSFLGGQCTYKELESVVMVSQSVIVRQMKKLELLGYVDSRIDEKDHRVKKGILTEKGNMLGAELMKSHMDAEVIAVSDFSKHETDDLIHLLQQVLKSVKN